LFNIQQLLLHIKQSLNFLGIKKIHLAMIKKMLPKTRQTAV
jgi:hypothetical protein